MEKLISPSVYRPLPLSSCAAVISCKLMNGASLRISKERAASSRLLELKLFEFTSVSSMMNGFIRGKLACFTRVIFMTSAFKMILPIISNIDKMRIFFIEYQYLLALHKYRNNFRHGCCRIASFNGCR